MTSITPKMPYFDHFLDQKCIILDFSGAIHHKKIKTIQYVHVDF